MLAAPTDRGFSLVRPLPVVGSLVIGSLADASLVGRIAVELSAVDAVDLAPPTPCRSSGCRSSQAEDLVLSMDVMAGVPPARDGMPWPFAAMNSA